MLSASLTAPNPPNGQKLTICVTGRQFIWRYTYGAGCNKDAWRRQASVLLPGDGRARRASPSTSLIQSSDVIHAWWMPSLGGKVDAVPGYTTYTWFKARHAGELYHGQCAQLCGRQHAFMTALVKVVTPPSTGSGCTSSQQLIKPQNNQVAQLRQELIKQGNLTASGTF